MGTIRIIILSLLLVSCGSKVDYQWGQHVFIEKADIGSIQFPDTNGQVVDLKQDPDVPTLIIFGEQFCLTCVKETKAIQNEIKNETGIPIKINLYTVLSGSSIDEAQEWKQIHKVKWTVGYDEKAELFHQFCPKKVVPCIVVHQPNKGIVFLKQDEVSMEELKSWTGPWED